MERMKSEFCGCCLGINATNSGYHTSCPFTIWLIATFLLLPWAAALPRGELQLRLIFEKSAGCTASGKEAWWCIWTSLLSLLTQACRWLWKKCRDESNAQITETSPEMQSLSFADLVSGASIFKKKRGGKKSQCFVTLLWPSFLINPLS